VAKPRPAHAYGRLERGASVSGSAAFGSAPVAVLVVAAVTASLLLVAGPSVAVMATALLLHAAAVTFAVAIATVFAAVPYAGGEAQDGEHGADAGDS
jgi:hypothetical protein